MTHTKHKFAYGAAALLAGFFFFNTTPVFGDYENFPEGSGKTELIRICTTCHDIESLPKLKYTKSEWTNLVKSMRDMGADGTEAEIAKVIDYLSSNFGKP